MKCSICKDEIEKEKTTGWDKGNNAFPINEGRCCDMCNCAFVIPARIKQIKNSPNTKIKIVKDLITSMEKIKDERRK